MAKITDILFITSILFSLQVSKVGSVEANDLGNPPNGYQWQSIPEVNIAALVPKGWHFKKETKENVVAFFITRDRIVEDEEFLTGFSANIILMKESSKVEELNAFARSLLKELIGSEQIEILEQPMEYPVKNSDAKSFTMTYEVKSPAGPIISHLSLSVDAINKRIYHHTFESPRSDWEKMQEYGKVIMNHIAILGSRE